MEADEVDGVKDVEDGSVVGVKNAAVRKLDHELGIPVGELKVSVFVVVCCAFWLEFLRG